MNKQQTNKLQTSESNNKETINKTIRTFYSFIMAQVLLGCVDEIQIK
jgi:hypothetical protein